MTKKTFNEEMNESVLIKKHALFAIKNTCSDSYENLSLELHNSLGKALTDFENSQKKIFGVSLKDKISLIKEYYKEYGHGHNVSGWKELECKRLAAKKSYIIARFAIENKVFNNIHPKDFKDDWDSRISDMLRKIETISGMPIYLYGSDNSYNYFTNPM